MKIVKNRFYLVVLFSMDFTVFKDIGMLMIRRISYLVFDDIKFVCFEIGWFF